MIGNIPLEVKPKKSTLLFSCPCEKKAASIHNKARSEIHKQDIGNIAYYILKAKQGLSVTYNDAKKCLIISALFASELLKKCLDDGFDVLFSSKLCQIVLAFIVSYLYAFILPDIANIFTYKNVIRECEDSLKNVLDENTLDKIKKLKWDDHRKLYEILAENKLEATLLYTDPYRSISRPNTQNKSNMTIECISNSNENNAGQPLIKKTC